MLFSSGFVCIYNDSPAFVNSMQYIDIKRRILMISHKVVAYNYTIR